MYSFLYMAQPSTIKSGNKINDTAPQIQQNYSTFPLSYRFAQTHQFAHITPHINFKSEEGFEDTFRAMAETDSLSLNAPLKSDIYQKRSNFFVPLQAILPRAWEYITVQPTNGDDVADQVNGVVSGEQLRAFLDKYCQGVANLITAVSEEEGSSDSFSGYVGNLIRNLLILEMFCSQGSLCKQLRYDFSHFFQAKEYVAAHGELKRVKPRSFDYFADKVLSAIAPKAVTLDGIHLFEVVWWNENEEETDHYIVAPQDYLNTLPSRENTEGLQYISYDHFLDMARQNLNFNIYILDKSSSWDLHQVEYEVEGETAYFWKPTDSVIEAFFGDFYNSSISDSALQISISAASAFQSTYNFNYLSAYQIICAHFFSWDFIDYVYSANIYRELMQFYCDKIVTTASQRVYNWNGLQLHYDALSGYYINKAFANCEVYLFDHPYTLEDETFTVFNWGYNYLTALFSFRHNLRYMDYFVGGRTRPLSVGNVGVAVSNNQVNVVDVIQQKNYAKWLNWSMRIGRKVSDYIKGKSKVEPRPDLHDPQWLSGTGDLVFAEKVQNTGVAQQENPNSITSNLKSNTNRYQFKYMADRVGYIIGVTTYDIPRAYAFATGRDNYHANRYDDFNPMLQYDGSQAVYKSELGLPGSTPFSYQTKYSEFKQMYDICAGGFVENLPGFIFIADTQSGVPMQKNLNPSYIRSWNEELSPFYISMTGHVLAKRFNFLVYNTNIINCHRPMEYQPQLM